jgi:Ca-activated chloride channel homolog
MGSVDAASALTASGRAVVKASCLLLACLVFAGEARSQALIHPAPELTDGATVPASSTTPPAPAAPAPDTTSPSTVFRSGVDLVALNVVVTDGQRFVSGLRSENFTVFEDGIQQDVSYFAATAVPLDLALLLDTSASMTDKIATVQQAASGFASTMRAEDRAMVVDIKDATRIIQPLTNQVPAVLTAIRSTTPRGGTGLYNGLYLTLKELVKERRGNEDVRRQAIVVFSDGDDTASLVSFDDVMDVAKQAGIAIYTITLKSRFAVQQASANGRRYFSQSEYSMKALAQETGARAFFPLEITELAGVYGSIGEELASQYALGYTPKNPRRDGSFRRVIVRVADRPGVQVRTRSGYTAPRPEHRAALN